MRPFIVRFAEQRNTAFQQYKDGQPAQQDSAAVGGGNMGKIVDNSIYHGARRIGAKCSGMEVIAVMVETTAYFLLSFPATCILRATIQV